MYAAYITQVCSLKNNNIKKHCLYVWLDIHFLSLVIHVVLHTPTSHVSRPSPPPVYDRLQYAQTSPYLDHVFLDTGALMAAQDGEQLIIRNEEEPREGISLGVQVVIETLLAALQPRVDHL